jgi:phosphoribosylaminoimidazolecarboxamide formyltransferase / IMP cyclohydrolase
MPRALLSVSDKTGVVEFARGLAARGYELLSTGGTAAVLTGAGLPVVSVSDVTGVPEMMDGRVKTLHPNIHAGILARRDRPSDLDALARHGIQAVDVVVVNLYPFAQTAAKPGATFDALIEQIDIGGPSLVRAAAKNFRDVLVVVHPDDYGEVLAEIDRGPSLGFRHKLMVQAFAHTAEYDATIMTALLRVKVADGVIERTQPEAADFQSSYELVDRLDISAEKIRDLRYGENPHQIAAWYRPVGGIAPGILRSGLGDARMLQGKELSYTNLLDLDAAARIVLEFSEPAAAVIKHTNPCGAAIGVSAADAYVQARDADSLAAFGGIVGLNRPIDVSTAEAIVSTFIEAVIAPDVDNAARPILAKKSKMRVMTASFDALKAFSVEQRSILGALLVQQRDRVDEAEHAWANASLPEGVQVVTRRAPTSEEWQALRFAWRVCAHVKSNAVVFTNTRRTLAIGAGQMSRVDAVNVAVHKAGREALAGSVAASDAYFPFRDGVDAIAAAGATAIVQPGGSIRDKESIAAAEERGMAMVFTGKRHFRH